MAQTKSIPSTKLHPLEFRVWRKLESLALEPGRVLVACSGGLDSIVLVECLARVAPRLKWTVEVVSVHHGRSATLMRARDRAFQLVEREARARGLVFHGRRRDRRLKELRSEAELREFRHRELRELVERRQAQAIVFAHHADDLFETRLIRLIRGTGPTGLKAMQLYADGILRPFLEEERATLEAYARSRGLCWSEDPSNRDVQPLRNWLRREWLPALEEKRPGAAKAFARSLDSVLDALPVESESSADKASEFSMDRARYDGLSRAEQRGSLAAVLRRAGRRDFSTGQLDEIRKRLAGRAREFTLLEMRWQINAQQFTVTPALRAGVSKRPKENS